MGGRCTGAARLFHRGLLRNRGVASASEYFAHLHVRTLRIADSDVNAYSDGDGHCNCNIHFDPANSTDTNSAPETNSDPPAAFRGAEFAATVKQAPINTRAEA